MTQGDFFERAVKRLAVVVASSALVWRRLLDARPDLESGVGLQETVLVINWGIFNNNPSEGKAWVEPTRKLVVELQKVLGVIRDRGNRQQGLFLLCLLLFWRPRGC